MGEAFLAHSLTWAVVYSITVNVGIAVAVYLGLYRPETKSGASVSNWAADSGRVDK